MNNQEKDWAAIGREASQKDEPSPSLLKALEILKERNEVAIPGAAIDLGCGFGRDTCKLLQEGWNVLAVDICEYSIEQLQESCAKFANGRLTTQLGTYGGTNWKPATLINASLALPYCHEEEFAMVWLRILASLIPGGVIVADFFGQLPGAPTKEPMVTLRSEKEIEQLFKPFDVEFYEEWYDDFINASDEKVRRVAYTVVARRSHY